MGAEEAAGVVAALLDQHEAAGARHLRNRVGEVRRVREGEPLDALGHALALMGVPPLTIRRTTSRPRAYGVEA